jgi:hypothetical protein
MKNLTKLLLISIMFLSISTYSQRPNKTDSGTDNWDYCPCVSGVQSIDYTCPCEIVLSNNERKFIHDAIIAGKPKASAADKLKASSYLKNLNFKRGGREGNAFLFSEDWWKKLLE